MVQPTGAFPIIGVRWTADNHVEDVLGQTRMQTHNKHMFPDYLDGFRILPHLNHQLPDICHSHVTDTQPIIFRPSTATAQVRFRNVYSRVVVSPDPDPQAEKGAYRLRVTIIGKARRIMVAAIVDGSTSSIPVFSGNMHSRLHWRSF